MSFSCSINVNWQSMEDYSEILFWNIFLYVNTKQASRKICNERCFAKSFSLIQLFCLRSQKKLKELTLVNLHAYSLLTDQLFRGYLSKFLTESAEQLLAEYFWLLSGTMAWNYLILLTNIAITCVFQSEIKS